MSELLQLRRVFTVVNGGTPKSDPLNWNGDIPWATPADLSLVNGQLLSTTERTLTPEGLAAGSRSVPGGSLIVSTRAPIGYVAETTRRMAFNQGCRGLAPRDELDIRYFRYQLGVMSDELNAFGQGSTFTELSSDALASVRVRVPPLEEQRAIADFLDVETARIDKLIDAKRRLITLLDERVDSVTRDGVCGILTEEPQTASRLPWLPTRAAGWREAKLNLVAQLGTGHTPSRSRPEWWEDCTIPWITTGEVAQMRDDRIEFLTSTRENISELGVANSSAVVHPAGTVVLSRTASAGFSAIMGLDMATSQDFVTWTCGPELEPRYLLLCLRAMRPDLLGRLAMGSTHLTIYMPDIESLRVPLPPLETQAQIVEAVWERLHALHDATDRLIRQIELLEEKRQALITAAVTGEFTVPGAAA